MADQKRRRGRGEGGIHQRSDGLWVASASYLDADGHRHRPTAYGTTKREAQEKLAGVLAAARRGGPAPAAPDDAERTLDSFVTAWLATARTAVGPTTHARYEQHWRLHMRRHLALIRLHDLTAADVARTLEQMEAAGDTAACRRKCLGFLRRCLKDAGVSSAHAAAKKIRLPAVRRAEMRTLTPAQARSLVEASASHRLGALLLLAIDSGARLGELFAIRWRDLSLDDGPSGVLHVRRSLVEATGVLAFKEQPKTRSGFRDIVLTPQTTAALRRMRAAATGSDDALVFTAVNGSPLRRSCFYRTVYRKLLAAAGVPRVRFHDLRHSAATILIAAGVDAATVSARLGHADVGTTLRLYVHTDRDSQRRAADAIGGAVFGDRQQSGDSSRRGRRRKKP